MDLIFWATSKRFSTRKGSMHKQHCQQKSSKVGKQQKINCKFLLITPKMLKTTFFFTALLSLLLPHGACAIAATHKFNQRTVANPPTEYWNSAQFSMAGKQASESRALLAGEMRLRIIKGTDRRATTVQCGIPSALLAFVMPARRQQKSFRWC